MQDKLVVPSPAKLNLGLHITGRREDGYHNLQTIFQLIDLCDSLSFELSNNGEISLDCDNAMLSQEGIESNLIYRAASALLVHRNHQQGVHISLDKRIPMGGGLGGGSSNAATTLLALNHLWQLNLSLDELMSIGHKLGADVPFFIFGNNAWAQGIGEQLQVIDLPKQYFVVLRPDCHVNTGQIFQHNQLTRDTEIKTIAHFIECGAHNDCEQVVRQLYPQVDQAFVACAEFGQAKLTGTGSCIYLSYTDEQNAINAFESLDKHFQVFICQSLDRSPTHQHLGIA